MNKRNVAREVKAIVKADKGPLVKQVKPSSILMGIALFLVEWPVILYDACVNACVGDYHLPHRVWSSESSLDVRKAMNGHYIVSG